MFFNPRYGRIGMISYPYWFFFEWLAPFFEGGGLILTLMLSLFGKMNWSFFLLLILLVYSFSVFFSLVALLVEELIYHQFKKKSEIVRIFVTAFIEPLIFHPMGVYAAIMGNFDFVTGRNNWGNMARKGFNKNEQEDKEHFGSKKSSKYSEEEIERINSFLEKMEQNKRENRSEEESAILERAYQSRLLSVLQKGPGEKEKKKNKDEYVRHFIDFQKRRFAASIMVSIILLILVLGASYVWMFNNRAKKEKQIAAKIKKKEMRDLPPLKQTKNEISTEQPKAGKEEEKPKEEFKTVTIKSIFT